MANRKISQLEFAFASDIKNEDLLTFVSVSEEDLTKKNKSIPVNLLANHIKSGTNLFPIPFATGYINPAAYINNQEKEINPAIAGQTVNINTIGKLYFDQYGRVYDIDTQEPNDVTSVDIVMAVGSASTYYKTPNVTGEGGKDVNNTGYFTKDTYYTDGRTFNVQKINYSNNVGNFINWEFLFEKNYTGFKHSTIDIIVGTSDVSGIWGNSEFHLIIDWQNRTITGNGIIQLWGSKSYSMIWNTDRQSPVNGGQVYKATIPNTPASSIDQRPVQAKVIVDFQNNVITGLPIWQGYDKSLDAEYPNYALPLNVIIKSFK